MGYRVAHICHKIFSRNYFRNKAVSTNLPPILLPHSVYLLYLFTNYQSCICSSHNFEHIDFFSLYLHQPAWPRCIIISSVVTQSANKKSATSSKQLLHIDWLAMTAPFFPLIVTYTLPLWSHAKTLLIPH